MKPVPFLFLSCASLLAQGPPPSVAAITAAGAPAAAPRPIDLAICLDISGSMDGLLDQARQNLWAVVNDLATLQPAPTLRVALLSFGCSAHDPQQGWVKVETDFTTDLDLVSQKLFAFRTNGGDEYVARVVQRALELNWSGDGQALKLLFVAGNEAATQDPAVAAADQSKAAIARGIVVNTIYCGAPGNPDAAGWRDVARLADGQFASIEQDQAVVITTPFDQQLAALSAALNPTYLPYGKQREVWAQNQTTQDGNAAGMNPAAAATRCQTKASSLYVNPHWDLVDACEDPKFELGKIEKLDLPEALRGLSVEQLRAHVAEKKQQRADLRKQIEALGKQRDGFVQQELAKRTAAGQKGFEQAVLEAVRQQAEARGFRRKAAEPPAAGGAAATGTVR